MKRAKTALKWLAVIVLSFVAGAATLVWVQDRHKANVKADTERLPRHPEAEAMVRKMLRALAIKADIQVRIGEDNCGSAGDGTIFLAPRCAGLSTNGRINWHIAHIIGHELGHLVNGHDRIRENSTPVWQQRDADVFAGFAMGIMGATREEVRNITMHGNRETEAGYEAYRAMKGSGGPLEAAVRKGYSPGN